LVLLSTLLKPCASPKRISKNGFRNGTGKASTQLYTAWKNTMMILNCGMEGVLTFSTEGSNDTMSITFTLQLFSFNQLTVFIPCIAIIDSFFG